MGTILTLTILASALLALVTGVSALRAGLRLRRTRLDLGSRLVAEVARLATRTTELEKNLTALDARAQALPIRINELQQNLATLRVLANALGVSLRGAQKTLSLAGAAPSPARVPTAPGNAGPSRTEGSRHARPGG